MISRIIRKVFVTTFHILAVKNSIQGFSNDCHDSSHYVAECPQWALNGQCTKSSEFMKKFCKKSCNECPMSLDSVGFVGARSFPHQQGTVHNMSILRIMHTVIPSNSQILGLENNRNRKFGCLIKVPRAWR